MLDTNPIPRAVGQEAISAPRSPHSAKRTSRGFHRGGAPDGMTPVSAYGSSRTGLRSTLVVELRGRERLGSQARRAFVQDLAARRYESPGLDSRDYETAFELDRRYADLDLGLADLSVAVLARKLGTRRLLTFDQRHFRAIRPLQGGTFTLLPADR